MGNEDLITQYVDRSKFSSDTDYIIANLKLVADAYSKLSGTRISLQGADTLKTIASSAKEASNAFGVFENQSKSFNASIQQNIKSTAESRVALAALNKEKKLAATVNEAERNSLGRAQALILQYTNEKKKLNLATEEGRRLNDNYNKAIQKSNDFILKNADAETKRTKNIGNYSKSAQIIVDALEKEKKKLEELERTRIRVQNAGSQFSPAASTNTQISRTQITGFAGGANSSGVSKLGSDAKIAASEINNLDKQIEQSRAVIEGFSRVTEQPKFLNVAGKLGDATQEVKFFTKSLIELERNGLGNSEAANALRGNLAELTDQIADAKAEVKALSSDTRGLDLFAGSISFAADAFQTAAGAAVLFGASEEDAAAATRTLIAVQSVANGVKGIANELTTRGTAANKVYAFAQNQVSIAMDSTASATARLRAALITIGIGALIIGIGLLVANFGKVREALGFANKAQEAYNETLKDYQEGAKEAIEKTNKVKLAFEQARLGIISKDKALKIYNESLGDALGKAKSLEEAETLYNEKAGTYIQIMGLKAQANALFAKSADEAAKGIVASTEDQTTFFDKLKIGFLQYVGSTKGAVNTMITAQEEGVKKEKKLAQERSDLLAANATKIANQAETLAKGLNINLDKKDKKNAAKKAKEDVDAVYEIYVLGQKRRIELFETQVNDEKEGYLERLFALTDFLHASEDLLDAQNEKEKSKKGLTNNEKLVIDAKYEDLRIKLFIDRSNKLEAIRNSQLEKDEKKREDFKKRQEESIKDLQKNSAGFLQASLDEDQKKREDALRKEQDLIERRKELYRNLYEELKTTAISFIEGLFEREQNDVQAKIELAEKEKNEKIRFVNERFISDKDKAEQTVVIEAVAQTKREELEKKQKEIGIKKAQFEKGAAIFDIGINTIKSIAAIKANIAVLLSNPITAPLAALAAAQIPITLAISAAQIGAIAARPIPKFKYGKNNDYQGLGIVDDGGKNEPIYRADTGQIEMSTGAPKDRITYLKRDDIVFPSIEAMMSRVVLPKIVPIRDNAAPINDMRGVIDAINTINIKTVSITKEGWREQNMRLEQYQNWVNKTIKN